MADVPELKEAFAQGQDIHAATAIDLFGEVNRDTRGRAKTVNFSILYGISRWGLAGRLEITPDEAQALIARYFERFPGISDYIPAPLAGARATVYTETLFGRKPWFPLITAASPPERHGRACAESTAPHHGPPPDMLQPAIAPTP